MAKLIPEPELQAIKAIVAVHPGDIGIMDIEDKLEEQVARRTLQYRLKHLVDEGRLINSGKSPRMRYLNCMRVTLRATR